MFLPKLFFRLQFIFDYCGQAAQALAEIYSPTKVPFSCTAYANGSTSTEPVGHFESSTKNQVTQEKHEKNICLCAPLI